jgi:hypothetical protein
LKSASNNPGAIGENVIAFIRLLGLPSSTANTDVTFDVPFGNTKQNPEINRSCGVAQSTGPLGVTDITTGARFPMSITHVVEKLNNPNWLLSPAVNVVVNVRFANPPQHANGNADPNDGSLGFPLGAAAVANVPLTRFALTGVTFVNGITRSGIASPSVSHTRFIEFVTVFPGRCSGTPVSPWNP